MYKLYNMTPKQKLQRDRAWFKYVLTGLVKPISLNSLTEEEKRLWNIILEVKDTLIEHHDGQSALLGLKVPEHRCWCGKKGEINTDIVGWACNKHKPTF